MLAYNIILKCMLVGIASFCSTLANPIVKCSTCSDYIIVDIRGTGERQGPSKVFITMNKEIFAAVPGGLRASDSNGFLSRAISADKCGSMTSSTLPLLTKTLPWRLWTTIHKQLEVNPDMCFILEGCSQGAAAVVDALQQISGPSFDAVKGVFLIGNPLHKASLACNVDSAGGTSTRRVDGSGGLGFEIRPGIPSPWVSKSLDVCARGDSVCDSASPGDISEHATYANDSAVQLQGSTFLIGRLFQG
ncbi:hypothetical protein E4T39_01460 [Aureobasidium subglaciale]|nr:hypothetical protein E4T39_01460 [Aureobasidium subglaciale]